VIEEKPRLGIASGAKKNAGQGGKGSMIDKHGFADSLRSGIQSAIEMHGSFGGAGGSDIFGKKSEQGWAMWIRGERIKKEGNCFFLILASKQKSCFEEGL
jgi:hypothetical protein